MPDQMLCCQLALRNYRRSLAFDKETAVRQHIAGPHRKEFFSSIELKDWRVLLVQFRHG
jgi:hypothetical protein